MLEKLNLPYKNNLYGYYIGERTMDRNFLKMMNLGIEEYSYGINGVKVYICKPQDTGTTFELFGYNFVGYRLPSGKDIVKKFSSEIPHYMLYLDREQILTDEQMERMIKKMKIIEFLPELICAAMDDEPNSEFLESLNHELVNSWGVIEKILTSI